MEVTEYLNQAYWLEHLIESREEDINQMRELSMSVSAVQFAENTCQSDNNNARFVKLLNKIDEYKMELLDEMDLLMRLKAQIRTAINTVPSLRGQAVLQRRHIQNQSWDLIAEKLSVSRSTVIRWYKDAAAEVKMPENPINVQEILQEI